jgi:fructose-1,6-bisphosphatase II / sedoheptulose-1,7-bisphosphatase
VVKEEAMPGLTNSLTFDAARVTEAAAVAAAHYRGRGDELEADRAAGAAMRRELDRLPIRGRVVIGEGLPDEASVLYVGEEVGGGDADCLRMSIGADPLEGATLCAKAVPGALSVIAFAQEGGLLNAPDVYMDKIAIGPGYDQGLVDLDQPPAVNLRRLAEAKGVRIEKITVCVLDRPRHGKLIAEIREAGAAIRLIGDGDIAGVIHTVRHKETGVDIYIGVGGAPEGVLAAAALRCTGGQMQGRLVFHNDFQRQQAREMGMTDLARKYTVNDMVPGDVIFAATGVTTGSLLKGVRFSDDAITTSSVVMRSAARTLRWISTEHMAPENFPIPES